MPTLTLPPILVLVKSELGLTLTSSEITYDTDITYMINKWELFLQLNFGLTDDQLLDENNWPPLARILISKLVVYDMILRSSKSRTFLGTGNLKHIKTGPSEAEWYDIALNVIKGGANGLTEYQQEICMLARRVGVHLYFCPDWKRSHLFIVGKKDKPC